MASIQLPSSSTLILKNEDKAVVEQMMKDAEKVLLSDNPNIEKEQLQLAGCILNISNRNRIQIHCQHHWCGQVSGRTTFPVEIPLGGTAKFVHYGGPLKGSKAAVVYACISRAWLLAWSISFGDEHNKVYVENGPKENYQVIDWYAIERKLEASGQTCWSEDSSTTCKSIAEISDGKKAKLGAMVLSG